MGRERGRGRPEREEDEGIEWEMGKEEAKETNTKGRDECRLKEGRVGQRGRKMNG